MKKYSMTEWLKIYNKTENDGETHITAVNLTKDLTVEYVDITTDYSATLTSWGGLTAKKVNEYIKGSNPQFVLEDDGTISFVVDTDEKLKSKIKIPEVNFKNPKVIPFDTWIKDIKTERNLAHKRDDDQYRYIKVTGCKLNYEGFIKGINADVTYNHDYGPFGPNKLDKTFRADDILTFVYGMHRDDICDEWVQSSFSDKGRKVFFNENFDLVYENDDKFHINKNLEIRNKLSYIPEAKEVYGVKSGVKIFPKNT